MDNLFCGLNPRLQRTGDGGGHLVMRSSSHRWTGKPVFSRGLGAHWGDFTLVSSWKRRLQGPWSDTCRCGESTSDGLISGLISRNNRSGYPLSESKAQETGSSATSLAVIGRIGNWRPGLPLPGPIWSESRDICGDCSGNDHTADCARTSGSGHHSQPLSFRRFAADNGIIEGRYAQSRRIPFRSPGTSV
jgi:hypothetical protein